MMIYVKKKTMIRPAEETPKRRLWSSNLDLLVRRGPTPLVLFYRRPSGSCTDFFDPDRLKDGLSRALVHYYPIAGRLTTDETGRIEIDCNAKGVLFVEAETASSVPDDLHNFFSPTPAQSKFIPVVDYSSGEISSFPLYAVQVTYFQCGGVMIGTAMYHLVGDGFFSFNFMKAWGEMVRGLNEISIPPVLDRTLLQARNPPQPKFHHIEYQPPPQLKTPVSTSSDLPIRCSTFRLTKEHINTLRSKAMDRRSMTPVRYSTFEILAAHVWISVCKARGLPCDQETKLYIATNGRFRLQPPLPTGYLGNAIFTTTPIAMVGDLISQPLSFASRKIHDDLAKVDNEYMQSALDYLEIQPDMSALIRDAHIYKSPNLMFTSWTTLPKDYLDLGWGVPVYMAPGSMGNEGMTYLIPSFTDDGSLYLAISLRNEHVMNLFAQYLYQIRSMC